MYYPLFLDLQAARCLVVGAGHVGLRKTRSLLAAGACEVLVLDPEPNPQLVADDWQALTASPALHMEWRTFAPGDEVGRALVFACTPDRAANAFIAATCVRQGILCNCADAPLEGNCIVPATARSGELTAALSTGGASPAWAKILREELEQWLPCRAAMTTLLGRLRPHVLAMKQNTVHNTALFRAVARSPLREALDKGDAARCRILLQDLLPQELHPVIGELLHELV